MSRDTPRVGGPCDHPRCLDRAHPDGCRSFAPSAFELQPGDAALVEELHAAGWYTGSPRDHDAWRKCTVPGPAYEQQALTPAQYRALKRLEQGRKADEREAAP